MGEEVALADLHRNQIALTLGWAYLGAIKVLGAPGVDVLQMVNGSLSTGFAHMDGRTASHWIKAARQTLDGVYRLDNQKSGEPNRREMHKRPMAIVDISSLGVLSRVQEPGFVQSDVRARALQALKESAEGGDDRGITIYNRHFNLDPQDTKQTAL